LVLPAVPDATSHTRTTCGLPRATRTAFYNRRHLFPYCTHGCFSFPFLAHFTFTCLCWVLVLPHADTRTGHTSPHARFYWFAPPGHAKTRTFHPATFLYRSYSRLRGYALRSTFGLLFPRLHRLPRRTTLHTYGLHRTGFVYGYLPYTHLHSFVSGLPASGSVYTAPHQFSLLWLAGSFSCTTAPSSPRGTPLHFAFVMLCARTLDAVVRSRVTCRLFILHASFTFLCRIGFAASPHWFWFAGCTHCTPRLMPGLLRCTFHVHRAHFRAAVLYAALRICLVRHHACGFGSFSFTRCAAFTTFCLYWFAGCARFTPGSRCLVGLCRFLLLVLLADARRPFCATPSVCCMPFHAHLCRFYTVCLVVPFGLVRAGTPRCVLHAVYRAFCAAFHLRFTFHAHFATHCYGYFSFSLLHAHCTSTAVCTYHGSAWFLLDLGTLHTAACVHLSARLARCAHAPRATFSLRLRQFTHTATLQPRSPTSRDHTLVSRVVAPLYGRTHPDSSGWDMPHAPPPLRLRHFGLPPFTPSVRFALLVTHHAFGPPTLHCNRARFAHYFRFSDLRALCHTVTLRFTVLGLRTLLRTHPFSTFCLVSGHLDGFPHYLVHTFSSPRYVRSPRRVFSRLHAFNLWIHALLPAPPTFAVLLCLHILVSLSAATLPLPRVLFTTFHATFAFATHAPAVLAHGFTMVLYLFARRHTWVYAHALDHCTPCFHGSLLEDTFTFTHFCAYIRLRLPAHTHTTVCAFLHAWLFTDAFAFAFLYTFEHGPLRVAWFASLLPLHTTCTRTCSIAALTPRLVSTFPIRTFGSYTVPVTFPHTFTRFGPPLPRSGQLRLRTHALYRFTTCYRSPHTQLPVPHGCPFWIRWFVTWLVHAALVAVLTTPPFCQHVHLHAPPAFIPRQFCSGCLHTAVCTVSLRTFCLVYHVPTHAGCGSTTFAPFQVCWFRCSALPWTTARRFPSVGHLLVTPLHVCLPPFRLPHRFSFFTWTHTFAPSTHLPFTSVTHTTTRYHHTFTHLRHHGLLHYTLSRTFCGSLFYMVCATAARRFWFTGFGSSPDTPRFRLSLDTRALHTGFFHAHGSRYYTRFTFCCV